jgi:hypothetical protein
MALYRTKAQKQQFIAMSAHCCQEGGPGHVVGDGPDPAEAQIAQAGAPDVLRKAVERTKHEGQKFALMEGSLHR